MANCGGGSGPGCERCRGACPALCRGCGRVWFREDPTQPVHPDERDGPQDPLAAHCCFACGAGVPTDSTRAGWKIRWKTVGHQSVREAYCGPCFAEWGWPEDWYERHGVDMLSLIPRGN